MLTAALAHALDPDADEARRWVLDELSEPQYEAAKPTWWDELVSAAFEWFMNLRFEGGAVDAVLFLIAIVVLAALVIGSIALFGRPRRRTRSAVTGMLFGEDERRSASELRRAAQAAADRGDWPTAVEERFRAIARGLEERTLVRTTPGTTARGFAAQAARSFPAHDSDLTGAAAAFDDVRYLGRPGTQEAYRLVERLDRELSRATPALAAREPATPNGALS